MVISTRPPASASAWHQAGTAPTTIREVLGETGSQQDELGLGAATLTLLRRDGAAGTTHYAAVVDKLLTRRSLMDLLFSIAPYKAHGPDDFSGVLDDWWLHDRAYSTGGASQSLLSAHAGYLGPSWREFTEHRAAFVAVAEDRQENTAVIPVIGWRRNARGNRSWDIAPLEESHAEALDRLSGLAEARSEAVTSYNALAGFLTVAYFAPSLRRRWPEWKEIPSLRKSNYMGPAQVPVLALQRRRTMLNSPLLPLLEASCEESR